MEILIRRCAGLDVHKAMVMVCVRQIDENGELQERVQEFGTSTRELLRLADWLAQMQVTDAAMESTGVYWKPIWHVLEGRVKLVLVNDGLLAGSFVPEVPQQQWRDLTRLRTQMVARKAQTSNRIQKVLEDANIKLASVASDVLGVSGRQMLQGIIYVPVSLSPRIIVVSLSARFPDDLAETVDVYLVGFIQSPRFNAHAGQFPKKEVPGGVDWLDDDPARRVDVAVLRVQDNPRPPAEERGHLIESGLDDDCADPIDEAPSASDLYTSHAFEERVRIVELLLDNAIASLVDEDGLAGLLHGGDAFEKRACRIVTQVDHGLARPVDEAPLGIDPHGRKTTDEIVRSVESGLDGVLAGPIDESDLECLLKDFISRCGQNHGQTFAELVTPPQMRGLEHDLACPIDESARVAVHDPREPLPEGESRDELRLDDHLARLVDVANLAVDPHEGQALAEVVGPLVDRPNGDMAL